MKPEIPVLHSAAPSDEQNRLVAFFDEAEKKELEFVNEAGKRIIELTTALLGMLFTVSAFGDQFPPAYLANNFPAQILVVATLGLYFLALGAGLLAVQPREYHRWENDLTEMRKERARLVHYKVLWFRTGSILFGLGSFSLASLIAAIVLSA
jgi:hypothetical protein